MQHRPVRDGVSREAGARLRAWLDERPSVSALAREAAVSRQTVHRVLAGEYPPSTELIIAAIRLGAPPSIFGGDR